MNENILFYSEQRSTAMYFVCCILLTSTAVSVGILLALIMGLRYRTVLSSNNPRLVTQWCLGVRGGGGGRGDTVP